ncbi:MAG: LytTR family DNA-binding domain-containing protein, partial [Acidobacteriota bacterium]
SFPERIPLRHGERTALVPVAEIRRLEAHRKKVRIYARDRIHEVRDSLKRFEAEDLDPRRFVRVNRSQIVHLAFVVEIQPWFHGERALVLDDGTHVFTSRRFRDRVRRALPGC